MRSQGSQGRDARVENFEKNNPLKVSNADNDNTYSKLKAPLFLLDKFTPSLPMAPLAVSKDSSVIYVVSFGYGS